MKKIILLAIFGFGFQFCQAQMTSGGGKGLSCVEEGLNYLGTCLTSNNVDYNLVNDGHGIAIITSNNNPPPGQVKSCIAKYNQYSKDCTEAPSIVYDTSNNNNQLQGTPK